MSRKLLNWEIELEMGMNFIGDGNEEGKTRHTHSNVACKTIPAIRVFLSVSLKPAPPYNPFGSFFNLRRCQAPRYGVQEDNTF